MLGINFMQSLPNFVTGGNLHNDGNGRHPTNIPRVVNKRIGHIAFGLHGPLLVLQRPHKLVWCGLLSAIEHAPNKSLASLVTRAGVYINVILVQNPRIKKGKSSYCQ